LDRDRNNNIFSSLTKRKTEEKEHYHPLTFHPSSLICTIYLHHKTDPFYQYYWEYRKKNTWDYGWM